MTGSILMFSRAIPQHQTGGMEVLAWNLAAEWAKAVGVQIVTTAIPGVDTAFTEEGIEVVPLAGTRPGRYTSAWWTESRNYWASLESPPLIVLSVSSGAYSVIRQRSRHPDIPFVMQAHGTSAMEIESKIRAGNLQSLATVPKNMVWLLRDIARYRHFDHVVAVGHSVMTSLSAVPQKWAVPANKSRVISNGVRLGDHDFDSRGREHIRGMFGFDNRTIVVACVGRLHIQKRLDRALRTAAILRGSGSDPVHFLFVGDGPDEYRLRRLANDLNVDDVVHFAGKVDRKSVRSYYSAADIALLTTARREGLPMSVLEALACGLPCVVTAGTVPSPALNDILYQADTADPRRLAHALRNVAGLGRPRTSLLPEEFLVANCARRYLDLFNKLSLPPGHNTLVETD